MHGLRQNSVVYASLLDGDVARGINRAIRAQRARESEEAAVVAGDLTVPVMVTGGMTVQHMIEQICVTLQGFGSSIQPHQIRQLSYNPFASDDGDASGGDEGDADLGLDDGTNGGQSIKSDIASMQELSRTFGDFSSELHAKLQQFDRRLSELSSSGGHSHRNDAGDDLTAGVGMTAVDPAGDGEVVSDRRMLRRSILRRQRSNEDMFAATGGAGLPSSESNTSDVRSPSGLGGRVTFNGTWSRT